MVGFVALISWCCVCGLGITLGCLLVCLCRWVFVLLVWATCDFYGYWCYAICADGLN